MKSFSISDIHNLKSNEEGFTLLELLIVIGVIAVLLAVAVVAINPGQQFAKVNNTRRTHNLQQIISAIQQNMIDNKGPFLCNDIPACNPDGSGTIMGSGAGQYDICACLVPNHLPQMPVDPQGGIWGGDCSNYNTQYEICLGSLKLRAPHAQLGEIITVNLPGDIRVITPPGAVDTIPPTVGSTSPTSATVNVATTFSASISDNVAVTSCNLFVDGVDQNSMTLSASPCASCSASKDHIFISTGTFSMYAKCSDAAGNITNGTSVSVNVTAPAVPDFSISANPVTIKAPQTGTSQSATITITSINNFNSAVNLSVTSGLPAGATANFNPNPVTPPPNGNATSDFTVSTSNVTAGSYTLTIRGQSGVITKTTNVTLEIVDLSVSLAADSSSGTAPLNGVDLTANVLGLATGTINYKFDCTSDGTWDFEVNNITSTAYTVIDLCNYPSAGNYTAKVFTQRDVANPATATITIAVAVPFDFSLSVSPNSGSVVQGSSISTTVTITLISGTTQSVNFSASGLPSGATASFSPSSCNPTCSSTMNITTVLTTPTGTYLITITGAGGGKTKTVTYNLTVTTSITESPVWQLCDVAVAPTLTCKAAMLKAYMGYKFVPGVKGQVTKLCGYFGGSTLTVKLYDGGYQEKAQASISSNQAWVCQSITPVDVSEGSTYYVLAAFPVGTNRYCMRKRVDSAPFLPENCGTTIDIKSTALYFTVVTPLPPLDPAQLYYADNEMWGMVDIIFAY